MGTKVKITNTSITKKKNRESVSTFEDYFFWKAKPVTDQWLEHLAEKYLHWAEHDDKALKVTQFVVANRISLEDFYLWMERSPSLKQAHKWVMQLLANRREIGAIERKYDASTIHRTMGHYDPIWKEQEALRAALAKADDDKAQNITVIVEKFKELEDK